MDFLCILLWQSNCRWTFTNSSSVLLATWCSFGGKLTYPCKISGYEVQHIRIEPSNVQDLHAAYVEPVKWGCYLIVICVQLEVFVWLVAVGKYAIGSCSDMSFCWHLHLDTHSSEFWVKSLEINCQSIFTATLLKLMSTPCHVIRPCGMVLHMMNMQFPFERF
jgi:hypothetical protein